MRSTIAIFLAATFLTGAAALAQAAPVNGRWLTQSRDAIVEVGPCGATVCGRIARFVVPPPQGNDQRDVNNPDPKLRNRKLLGMAVVFGLKPDGEQWRGMIYDPKTGKSYRSVVFLTKKGTLNVKGCIGPICRGQSWTRSSQ